MAITIDGTAGISYPTWTTAGRPSSPVLGQTGFNTTLTQLEVYNGSFWAAISVVSPVLLSVTGDIYSGLQTSLTLIGTNFGTAQGIMRFAAGATIINIPTTPSSPNTISTSVPAGIYALAGGTTVTISYINSSGISTGGLNIVMYGEYTGGTKVTSGTYTYHTFTSSGNLTFPKATNVEYLLIAGGGAGGHRHAGGGGAGGVLSGTFAAQTQAYGVVIGAGGTKIASSVGQVDVLGPNGNNSTIFNLVAIGGGGGGSNNQNGVSGGSGGGSGEGTQTGGAGTSGQGYKGGDHPGGGYQGGGGGGGSGGVGANGPYTLNSNTGSRGGPGLNTWSSWALATSTGVLGYYAAGGGAGGYQMSGFSPQGGGAGAGNGGGDDRSGTDATANTGSGGGGGGQAAGPTGGNGGSGIVIVRYLTPV